MHLILWPVTAIGRLVAITMGVACLLAGAVLTATVVGSIVGIPLFLFGLMLVARGLF